MKHERHKNTTPDHEIKSALKEVEELLEQAYVYRGPLRANGEYERLVPDDHEPTTRYVDDSMY